MMHWPVPRLVHCLKQYTPRDLIADVIAGMTVGLVALPLAMAFGIASNVTPEAGLYTAVVAGFLVSALGGSRFQIAGPTGAFVVIVAGIVTRFGFPGLLVCTLMAGAMLVVMGLTGLGAAVRFIPRPVTIGFTNGIALLIASTQIKDFFGLSIDKVPSEFLERLKVLAENMPGLSLTGTGVALAALGIIVLTPRLTKRVPGSIAALLLTTVGCVLLNLPVETIGSRFGGIPTGFPKFATPELHLNMVVPLLPSAFTVALLGAIESMLSAVVADSMTGDRHDSNVELIGQGVANLATPFFGGIPATGAIARTATNIRSGARSPVAGLVHALTLLVVLLAAAPLARFVPLATLAAVLLMVAYNMGEWRHIPAVLRLSLADIAVWAVTFILTVLADLTVAVEVGLVLAALLYIRRVAETTTVVRVTEEYLREGRLHALQDKQLPPYVTLLGIHGPFLVGTTDKLEKATADLDAFTPIVILKLRYMTALDSTAVSALEMLARRLQASGRSLILCGARWQPKRILRRSELPHLIGRKNLQPHVEAALARAHQLYRAGHFSSRTHSLLVPAE
jgi:SulP family sulfate permease